MVLESSHCCLHIQSKYLLLMDLFLRKLMHFWERDPGDEGPFGFPRWMSFRSEYEAFSGDNLSSHTSIMTLRRVILLRFEIRVLLRPLFYLPPPGNV